MATRTQKRANRMRAKHHTNFHGTGTGKGPQPGDKRKKKDVGGTREQVRRDLRNPNSHVHLDRAVSFAAAAGFEDPKAAAYELRDATSNIAGILGGDAETIERLENDRARTSEILEPFVKDYTEKGLISNDEDGSVDLSGTGPEGRTPTSQEWDEMVALAKSRKKGVGKIAQREGWTIEKGADPKAPESWTVWPS